MTYLCIVLDIHQPIKLNKAFPYERAKRIAEGSSLIDRYFDKSLNQELFSSMSKKCYRPALETILAIIQDNRNLSYPPKIALNLTGLFLEQMGRYEPELVNLVKKLLDTKMVELLGGTYFHSLASLYPGDRGEFIEQIKIHREYVKKFFGVDTKVFANTGYIYNDGIGKSVEEMGFEGLLAEGTERVLAERSLNRIYCSKGAAGLKILFRHQRLANDISINFFRREWSEYPLTADKYAGWLSSICGDIITISSSIETLAEGHSTPSDIFEFLRRLPVETNIRGNLEWTTPSEAILRCPSSGVILIPETNTISCDGERKDMTPWLGNNMQRISYDRMASLGPYVTEISDNNVAQIWRLLQQSDHLKYMSTERTELSNERRYYTPYSSPAEAYAVFNSVFTDFEGKVATIVQRIRKAKTAPVTPQLHRSSLQSARPSVVPGASYFHRSDY
jgi:alpha-amylase